MVKSFDEEGCTEVNHVDLFSNLKLDFADQIFGPLIEEIGKPWLVAPNRCAAAVLL